MIAGGSAQRGQRWCRSASAHWRLNGLAAAVRNDGADRLYQRLGYSDWGHGLVAGHGDETGSAGTVLKTNTGPCCYLTQVDRLKPGRATDALVMPLLV